MRYISEITFGHFQKTLFAVYHELSEFSSYHEPTTLEKTNILKKESLREVQGDLEGEHGVSREVHELIQTFWLQKQVSLMRGSVCFTLFIQWWLHSRTFYQKSECFFKESLVSRTACRVIQAMAVLFFLVTCVIQGYHFYLAFFFINLFFNCVHPFDHNLVFCLSGIASALHCELLSLLSFHLSELQIFFAINGNDKICQTI